MTIERMNYPEGYFPPQQYQARWSQVSAERRRRRYELAIVWGKTAGSYERAMEILAADQSLVGALRSRARAARRHR